jgi:hypothetical protein
MALPFCTFGAAYAWLDSSMAIDSRTALVFMHFIGRPLEGNNEQNQLFRHFKALWAIVVYSA